MKCCCGVRGWGLTGLVVSIVAAVFTGTFSTIYHAILNLELRLEEGSIQYDVWMDSPVPMYIRFHMFNVSNADDVILYGKKPILHQLGPYTYREWHYRVNLEKYDNSTLRFQQQRTWQFVPELTNGSLSDMITTLNVPLVSAAHAVENSSSLVKRGLEFAVKQSGSTIFITRNVSQLLFDGYDDPLVSLAQFLPEGVAPPYDKFGWFYTRNNSDYYDGVFNIFTGASDPYRVGDMDMWNLTRSTKYYESYCSQVNGSFGEVFPPNRKKTNITLYSTDLCRSMTLPFKEEVLHRGVNTYRYGGTPQVFDNGTLNPDNWCFCVKGKCHPSGVVDSSTCRFGSPAFVSFPHFLYADPFYREQVDGMEPDETLHDFYVDLEPVAGIPAAVAARLQINILMEPVKGLSFTQGLPRTYLPILWFGVNAELNEGIASLLSFVLALPTAGTATFFAFFCIGLCLMAACSVVYVKKRNANKAKVTAARHDEEREDEAINHY